MTMITLTHSVDQILRKHLLVLTCAQQLLEFFHVYEQFSEVIHCRYIILKEFRLISYWIHSVLLSQCNELRNHLRLQCQIGFIELKGNDRFKTAMNNLLKSNLADYMKKYLVLLPGDWPAQFFYA